MSGELAGRLRSRVTILRRVTTRDAIGGSAGDWVTIGQAWAGLTPDGTSEPTVGDAPSAALRWKVTLRTGADVTIGDRLLWRGRVLRVRRLSDDPAEPDRIMLDTQEER